jgi:GNAT superfamily N-acetyltransferase
VRNSGDTIFIESERAEFTYAILGRNSRLADLPSSVKAIQLLPWSLIRTEELEQKGFVATIGFSYMLLNDGRNDWPAPPADFKIARVQSATQMESFSEVQCRGFSDNEEGYRLWHPWIRAANFRNINNPQQTFYVGDLKGEAAGVTLTVSDGDVTGIYAVATLPHKRRHGVSTALLAQAIHDARASGSRQIILQVKQDSPTEEFYRKLGFKRIFATTMYRRA